MYECRGLTQRGQNTVLLYGKSKKWLFHFRSKIWCYFVRIWQKESFKAPQGGANLLKHCTHMLWKDSDFLASEAVCLSSNICVPACKTVCLHKPLLVSLCLPVFLLISAIRLAACATHMYGFVLLRAPHPAYNMCQSSGTNHNCVPFT